MVGVLMLLAAALVASTTAQEVSGYAHVNQAYCSSAIYGVSGTSSFNVQSSAGCAEKCDSNSDCYAFSYKSHTGSCMLLQGCKWLKTASTNTYSMYMKEVPVSGFSRKMNYGCSNAELDSPAMNDATYRLWGNCAQKCNEHTTCTVFSVQRNDQYNSGTCRLYDTCQQTSREPIDYVVLYTKQTACDDEPCKNSGECSPVGDNDFSCDCSNTLYTGDTCEDMPGLSTICGSTEVTITIDSTQVTDIDTSHLHIGVNPNDASCQSTPSGNNIVFTIPLDSCDPATTDDNGNIVYTYDILGNSTKETSIISRKNMMGIVVKCRYPTDKVLSTYIKAGISQVEYMGSAMGHFEFAIGMFKDSDLMTTLNKGSEVAIGETIFVKVDFTGPASLTMVVKDCIASPTSNTTATVSWPLIENGCYKTDTTGNDLDSTVEPLSAQISDHQYAFKFDSFRFLNVDTSDVYITCDLHVCGPNEENCVNPVVCEKTGMVAAKRSTESRIPYTVNSLSFSPVAAG